MLSVHPTAGDVDVGVVDVGLNVVFFRTLILSSSPTETKTYFNTSENSLIFKCRKFYLYITFMLPFSIKEGMKYPISWVEGTSLHFKQLHVELSKITNTESC